MVGPERNGCGERSEGGGCGLREASCDCVPSPGLGHGLALGVLGSWLGVGGGTDCRASALSMSAEGARKGAARALGQCPAGTYFRAGWCRLVSELAVLQRR